MLLSFDDLLGYCGRHLKVGVVACIIGCGEMSVSGDGDDVEIGYVGCESANCRWLVHVRIS